VPQELDEPPSDLPPALAGTVVDEHADVQDVVATVVDLAERGIIGLTEVRDPKLSGSQRDFELTLEQPDARGLRGYERLILDSFFANGSPVRLSRLGGWFHRSIPRIQEELHREVARAGLLAGDPDEVRRRYKRLGTILMVVGAAGAFVACAAAPAYAAAIPWPLLGVAVVGVLLRWVAPKMPRRTAAGGLEAARWRAYARFLAKSPAELLRSKAPDAPSPAAQDGDVFERVLPYAIALGIERTWVQKFATVGTPAPRWLRTPPVVVVGGPTWGGPWVGPYGGGPWGGPWAGPGRGPRGGATERGNGPPPQGGGPGGLQDWSDSAAGGLERSSGSLADLLNAASEVLSRGGGSGWSGGGFGGGGGGSGGGGSGGGGSGFS
jgi:hypothetical protein